MKVTVIPVIIGRLGMIPKSLIKGLANLEIGGRVKTVQTTAVLKSLKILRNVLET